MSVVHCIIPADGSDALLHDAICIGTVEHGELTSIGLTGFLPKCLTVTPLLQQLSVYAIDYNQIPDGLAELEALWQLN